MKFHETRWNKKLLFLRIEAAPNSRRSNIYIYIYRGSDEKKILKNIFVQIRFEVNARIRVKKYMAREKFFTQLGEIDRPAHGRNLFCA